MFVNLFDTHIGVLMWSDSRLVSVAPYFCLCGSCAKHGKDGKACPTHKRFVETTRELEVSAPIFGCPNFKELDGGINYLDQYCDGDELSRAKLRADFYEKMYISLFEKK